MCSADPGRTRTRRPRARASASRAWSGSTPSGSTARFSSSYRSGRPPWLGASRKSEKLIGLSAVTVYHGSPRDRHHDRGTADVARRDGVQVLVEHGQVGPHTGEELAG